MASIILPTYNRAPFLPQAFDSIRAQSWTDWELIIVDDGSTDATPGLVEEFLAGAPQPVRYIRQVNAGPYAARNTGLDAARGDAIAFFDSDDVWLPHHLKDCMEALTVHRELDWAYGSCRIMEFATGRQVTPSTFYPNGKPRPFLKLRGRRVGRLYLIDDPEAVRCQILHGLYCGLQNSVMRRRVFDGYRFEVVHRSEAEDQVVVIRSLAAGFRFGYFDNVHVIYNLHEENSSGAATNTSLERKLRIYQAIVRGFEDMRERIRLSPRETRALNQRLSDEFFWHIGYALLWQNGRRPEALAMFREGLRRRPLDIGFWKTYLLALLRTKAGFGLSLV